MFDFFPGINPNTVHKRPKKTITATFDMLYQSEIIDKMPQE